MSNTFKRPNTVLTGTRAYQALADAWGIPVDDLYTDAYREARADIKAWQELTFTIGGTAIQNIVTSTPRSKWATEIKKQVTESVSAQLVKDADLQVKHALDRRVNTVLTDDVAWRHVATALDVDKAVQDFQQAVNDLGKTIYDPVKAAQKNPASFTEYMKRAPQLLYLDALTGRSKEASAALHADIPALPELKYRKDNFNLKTKYYSEEDLDMHRAGFALRDKALNDDVLIQLALGEFPGFELATSLDPTEYRARRERLSELNKTKEIQ